MVNDFRIGTRVRVSALVFDERLHGSLGTIIQEEPIYESEYDEETDATNSTDGVEGWEYRVEFDTPWVDRWGTQLSTMWFADESLEPISLEKRRNGFSTFLQRFNL